MPYVYPLEDTSCGCGERKAQKYSREKHASVSSIVRWTLCYLPFVIPCAKKVKPGTWFPVSKTMQSFALSDKSWPSTRVCICSNQTPDRRCRTCLLRTQFFMGILVRPKIWIILPITSKYLRICAMEVWMNTDIHEGTNICTTRGDFRLNNAPQHVLRPHTISS